MRRTKEDAELTRQSVLKAATKVFSRKGYAATRLEDIAAAAKVTRGAIYHHFDGKAELFTEIIDNASQTFDQAIQRAREEGGTFLEIAERIIVYSIQLLTEDSQYRAAMALLLFNAGDSPELLSMRKRRLEQGKAQLEQIVGFFRVARAQGAIRPDLDPEVGGRAFLAYQNGLFMLELTSPGILNAEQHAKKLAEFFVQGMVP